MWQMNGAVIESNLLWLAAVIYAGDSNGDSLGQLELDFAFNPSGKFCGYCPGCCPMILVRLTSALLGVSTHLEQLHAPIPGQRLQKYLQCSTSEAVQYTNYLLGLVVGPLGPLGPVVLHHQVLSFSAFAGFPPSS